MSTAPVHVLDNDLHSVRAELRPKDAASVLIPKALADYGLAVAGLYELSDDLDRRLREIDRLEKQLRENGCTPPRPDLSPELRAAWRVHRGELP